jgi:hypothetical protein
VRFPSPSTVIAGRKSRRFKRTGWGVAAPGAATVWSAFMGSRDLRPDVTGLETCVEQGAAA